ncbi:MAG: gliding motility-associated C-terminal domain-containing protein [Runella sp.]
MQVVPRDVGCAKYMVTVRNTHPGSKNSRYIYDYRGGSPEAYNMTKDTVFEYIRPGIYTIMQVSETAEGQRQHACRRITVQDPTPPTFRVLTCTNGSVRLDITSHASNPYEEYAIDWGDGNLTILNRTSQTASHRYTNLSPKQVSVKGIHRVTRCGGTNTQTVSLEVNTRPATIVKLEVIASNTAEITVQNPNLLDLELLRQEGLGSFQTTGLTLREREATTKVLIDTAKIFCYKLKPRDTCVAALESNVLCTSFLKILPDIEQNTIVLSPYLYPNDITKAEVTRNETLWWTPGRTDLFKLDREADCGRPSCYRLRLNTQEGTVLSNVACAEPPPGRCLGLSNVYIPDAFTPNGDGINDFFEIKAESDVKIEVVIFNRWGAPIFSSSPTIRLWNGTINGQQAPIGPYFYQVQFTDKIGRSFVKRGTVALLR